MGCVIVTRGKAGSSSAGGRGLCGTNEVVGLEETNGVGRLGWDGDVDNEGDDIEIEVGFSVMEWVLDGT